MERAQIFALPRSQAVEECIDEISLRHLVLEHYDREQLPLRRYLSFLGVNSDMSQEIVQDSFLKLHQHLLTGGDRGNLRAWLYRVAHNLARNAQMSSAQKRSTSLSDVTRRTDIKADAISAEEGLLSRERVCRLRDAVARLTPAQKECLALRSQGFKYREIADVLNLSVSTIAENIQRGLEKLKELL